jgi:hypothetical protein
MSFALLPERNRGEAPFALAGARKPARLPSWLAGLIGGAPGLANQKPGARGWRLDRRGWPREAPRMDDLNKILFAEKQPESSFARQKFSIKHIPSYTIELFKIFAIISLLAIFAAINRYWEIQKIRGIKRNQSVSHVMKILGEPNKIHELASASDESFYVADDPRLIDSKNYPATIYFYDNGFEHMYICLKNDQVVDYFYID